MFYSDEQKIFYKVSYMTMEQQERILKLIEKIELADKLIIPRIIIVNDNEFCRIWSKNDHMSTFSNLGTAPVEDFIDYMSAEHKLLIGEPTAQKVIEEIGSVQPLSQERTFMIMGRHLETGLPAKVEISSIQVRDTLSITFDNTFFASLQHHLTYMPLRHKISREELSQAQIYLRGYLRSIRGLDQRLQEATGLKVIVE